MNREASMGGAVVWKPVAVATLVCGTLDILFAIVLTLLYGREPAAMLRYVASGPVPPATEWGAAGSALGLAVHFALVLAMVAAYMLAARRWSDLLDRSLLSGILFGLITYVIMNWIVVPLRFDVPLPPRPLSVATQLFAHVALVGLPTAYIARRFLRG